MTRINIVLSLALVASAMYLVGVQYEARRVFVDLDRAQAQARRLQFEHERLQVELRGQATTQRVERIARDQLQMRMPNPAITQYVQDSAAASQGPASAAAAGAAQARGGVR